MGDIYVHVRMKECCRGALKGVDQHRKKAQFKGSWLKALGHKAIDAAREAIVIHEAMGGGELERLTQAICQKLCEQHAALHEGKGETEEGAFWRDLGGACVGKAAVPPSTTRKPPGAHGKLGGQLYVVYANEVRVGGHRNWRNNNPGNLDFGDFAKRHGAIGGDGTFAIFPDEATGAAAQKSLLRGPSYKDLTIVATMTKFAPPKENNTALYIANLEKGTGLSGDKTMGSLTDEQMDAFTTTMKKLEGWNTGVGDVYTADSPTAAGAFKKLLGA